MNPLETLIAQLTQQAGPRGSTFAGRVIPQGQTPSLQSVMSRLPTESPDAEGMGGVAMAAAASGAGKGILKRGIAGKARYFDAPNDAIPSIEAWRMPTAIKNSKTGEIFSTGKVDPKIGNVNFHSELKELNPQWTNVEDGFIDPATSFFYPRKVLEKLETRFNPGLLKSRMTQEY